MNRGWDGIFWLSEIGDGGELVMLATTGRGAERLVLELRYVNLELLTEISYGSVGKRRL
jgi:hypothetical protein